MKDQILNIGLNLAMEWGENWLVPIQARLKEKFPELSEDELADDNTKCQKAIKSGHDFVYNKLEAFCKENVTISGLDLIGKLRDYLNLKYNWINDENLSSIMSQGCYYVPRMDMMLH